PQGPQRGASRQPAQAPGAGEPVARLGLAQRAEPEGQPVPGGEGPDAVRVERRVEDEQPGAVPVEDGQPVPSLATEDPQGPSCAQLDPHAAPAAPDEQVVLDGEPRRPPGAVADRTQLGPARPVRAAQP